MGGREHAHTHEEMELVLVVLWLMFKALLWGFRAGVAAFVSVMAVAFASAAQPFRPGWIADRLRSHVIWKRIAAAIWQHRVVCMTQETLPPVAIYAGYPHGLVPISAGCAVVLHGGKWKKATGVAPPMLLASSVLLRIPLVRQLANMGGMASVSRANMLHHLLNDRKSVYVMPGGVQEMLLARSDRLDLYLDPSPPHLREHRGFLRLAWAHKIPVVPVYEDGQHALYHIWNPSGMCGLLGSMRRWTVKRFGYPFPTVFWGPRVVPLLTRVGAPVSPEQHDSYDAFVGAFYAGLGRLLQHHSGQLDPALRVYLKCNDGCGNDVALTSQ